MESSPTLPVLAQPISGREGAQNVSVLPKMNEWCIVRYDEHLYVGQVTKEDDDNMEVEISTLTQTKTNQFKFRTRYDKIWYTKDQVIKNVAEPSKLSRRMLS